MSRKNVYYPNNRHQNKDTKAQEMIQPKNPRVAVFVCPSELTFYLQTISTHKQLLRLFNPYEIPLRFEVFLISPEGRGHYDIKERTGSLGPLRSDDVNVRLTVTKSINPQNEEKLSIRFIDATSNKILGQRTVPLILVSGEKESRDFGPKTMRDVPMETEINRNDNSMQLEAGNSVVRYYVLIMSTFMLFSLLLPTKRNPPEESSIPQYLHISESVKYIFSYVLGIITVILIRNL